MGLSGRKRRGQGLASLLVSGALVLAFAAPVSAAGESTPGVTLTAVNPAESWLGSDLALALVANTERVTVADPSCRPQDGTIKCWGSLMLRLPRFGDLAVGDFDVHRVAIGDIACDDEGEEDGGCDHEMAVASLTTQAVLAQVNGVASVKWPGNSGLAIGTKLQVKLTLMDYGPGLYTDQIVVQVNRFVEGSNKPLLYQSGPETIQQVAIHIVNGGR